MHNYQRLTYGEVDRRANMLAHWLLANGVQPDTAVAVCMDKRPELYIALLAILKAGGAYLHVDPALPQERAIFVLQQAGARILLTQVRAGVPVVGISALMQVASHNRQAAGQVV